MKGLNIVQLIGRLGQDPDMKHFESGAVVAQFNLATDESYVKDGKKVEKLNWHRVVAWNRLAEIMEKYLKKGDKIYIEGSLQNRTYEDRDGTKRVITEIVAKNLIMLGSPSSGTSKTEPHAGDEFLSGNFGDDLPY